MNERYRCIRCHAYQDEPAADGCHNPIWHDGKSPPAEPPKARLPYAEEDQEQEGKEA